MEHLCGIRREIVEHRLGFWEKDRKDDAAFPDHVCANIATMSYTVPGMNNLAFDVERQLRKLQSTQP